MECFLTVRVKVASKKTASRHLS